MSLSPKLDSVEEILRELVSLRQGILRKEGKFPDLSSMLKATVTLLQQRGIASTQQLVEQLVIAAVTAHDLEVFENAILAPTAHPSESNHRHW